MAYDASFEIEMASTRVELTDVMVDAVRWARSFNERATRLRVMHELRGMADARWSALAEYPGTSAETLGMYTTPFAPWIIDAVTSGIQLWRRELDAAIVDVVMLLQINTQTAARRRPDGIVKKSGQRYDAKR